VFSPWSEDRRWVTPPAWKKRQGMRETAMRHRRDLTPRIIRRASGAAMNAATHSPAQFI